MQEDNGRSLPTGVVQLAVAAILAIVAVLLIAITPLLPDEFIAAALAIIAGFFGLKNVRSGNDSR